MKQFFLTMLGVFAGMFLFLVVVPLRLVLLILLFSEGTLLERLLL